MVRFICEKQPQAEVIPVPLHHGDRCRAQHTHAHPGEPGEEMPDEVCCEGRILAQEGA